MRSRSTNPTVRIGNLLAEIEALREWIALANEESLHTYPIPPPLASQFEYGFRLARGRDPEDTRKAMRRSRLRRAEGYHIRATSEYNPSQDKSIIEEAAEGFEPQQEPSLAVELPSSSSDITDIMADYQPDPSIEAAIRKVKL